MADEARFTELYERHYRSVYAYCLRRTDGDHVEDVVAETFFVAWRKIDQVPAGSDSLPWLYAVAYRALLHHWRGTSRKRRLEKRLAAVPVDVAPTPEHYLVTRHESRQVLDAAAHLRQIDREILRLSLWEELPHSDIATVLELTEPAVRKRLSRALDHLTREFNRLERRKSTPAARKGGAP